jgi:hypothetical protein
MERGTGCCDYSSNRDLGSMAFSMKRHTCLSCSLTANTGSYSSLAFRILLHASGMPEGISESLMFTHPSGGHNRSDVDATVQDDH